jgi:hypothetical protein
MQRLHRLLEREAMGFTNPRDSRVGFTVSDLHTCTRIFEEKKSEFVGICAEKIRDFSRATLLIVWFYGVPRISARNPAGLTSPLSSFSSQLLM